MYIYLYGNCPMSKISNYGCVLGEFVEMLSNVLTFYKYFVKSCYKLKSFKSIRNYMMISL